jgi:hypothetical protein
MKVKLYERFIKDFEPFEVTEGLIQSVEPAHFVRVFSRIINSKNITFDIEYEDNGNIFIILNSVSKPDIDFIFSMIANLGYYVSDFTYSTPIKRKFDKEELFSYFIIHQKIDLTVYVEPYYDREIQIIPKLLYHCTPKIHLDKILKNGLYPKSKNKLSSHPPRVFLCDNLNKTISLVKQFKYQSNLGVWTILEIDTSKIKEFKIYIDPNYKNEGGVYTMNNITPNAIRDLNMNI